MTGRGNNKNRIAPCLLLTLITGPINAQDFPAAELDLTVTAALAAAAAQFDRDTGPETETPPGADTNGAFRNRLSAAAATAPRQKVRAKVINWIRGHNDTVGRIADFIAPGSDMAVHLSVDPRDAEVVLEWDLKF